MNEKEKYWLEAWNDFVVTMRKSKIEIPGFPLWTDDWIHLDQFQKDQNLPEWKNNFLQKAKNGIKSVTAYGIVKI